MIFLGPLLFAGGFLAIWRTGQRSVFYALLGLIGLIVWAVGAWMSMKKEQ